MLPVLAATAALALVLIAAGLLPGCSGGQEAVRPVRMATTTSTANTGLLDYLFDAYRQETGIEVQFIAVGTGKALKHGENGDVDIVLVHAPPAEEAFVAAGFGVARVPVMWNDFVILGAAEDPAGVRDAGDVVEVFRRIQAAGQAFISRGDDSGTHKKERAIWEAAGIQPSGSWYIEAGQGMDACLLMAGEKQAYVLTDRGSYLARRANLGLELLYAGDALLANPYALIAVSPERYPDLNTAGARQLIAWMTSPHGQQLIAGFRVEGEILFHPVDEGQEGAAAPAGS
jgi:tungstate transport system substrate-binding protein